MVSLFSSFLVGQPNSGSCQLPQAASESAAASLIWRGQALSHAEGCGAELELPTAPWVGWERTEGAAEGGTATTEG